MDENEFYDKLRKTILYTLPQNYDIDNIINEIKRQKINIKLSRLNQHKLIGEIWRTMEKSRVIPFKPVGLVAAGSMGEGLTQSTFKSFSRPGALEGRVAYSGISRIKEILGLSNNSKDKSMTVIFKEPKRDYEIRNIMGDMVYTVISDLVLNREVLDYKKEPWYKFYTKIHDKFDPPEKFMRLYIDVNNLFVKKITLQDIVDKINEENKAIKIIPSPINLGYIDIFLLGVTDEKTKLEIEIFPEISSIPLNGIKGVRKIYPSFISLSLKDITQDKIKKYNILPEELVEINPLITLKDITLKIKHNKIYLDEDKVKKYNPSVEQMLSLLKDYNPILENGKLSLNSDVDVYTLLETPIVSLILQDKKNHWYIETEGSNLYDIWKLSYVEPKKTISNDIMEIYRILGIEAARKMIYDELVNNGFVPSSHLMLLCDDMSLFGYLNSVDKQGISLKDFSALGSMIFEKSMQTAMELSATGAEDPISGLPSNVIVGRLAKIGSGAVEFRRDLNYE